MQTQPALSTMRSNETHGNSTTKTRIVNVLTAIHNPDIYWAQHLDIRLKTWHNRCIKVKRERVEMSIELVNVPPSLTESAELRLVDEISEARKTSPVEKQFVNFVFFRV